MIKVNIALRWILTYQIYLGYLKHCLQLIYYFLNYILVEPDDTYYFYRHFMLSMSSFMNILIGNEGATLILTWEAMWSWFLQCGESVESVQIFFLFLLKISDKRKGWQRQRNKLLDIGLWIIATQSLCCFLFISVNFTTGDVCHRVRFTSPIRPGM